MNFVFNELSLRALPRNNTQANFWLNYYFKCLIEVSKRRDIRVFVISHLSFNQVLISPTYSFSHWLFTQKDIEFTRLVRTMISKKPFSIDYPEYKYRNNSVIGLGVAHFENLIASSYPCNSWKSLVRITRLEFNDHEDLILKNHIVKNISSLRHVDSYFPILLFEHHLKHDNHRLNLKDGESTLLYNIPKEMKIVQKLLEGSLKLTSGAKRYNYDKNRGLYIEFQSHQKNRYHGYHIKDKTRVPYKLRKILEQ